MIGAEFALEGDPSRPAGAEVKTVLKRCLSRGVLAIPAGSHGNVIRVLSPLTIEDDLLERALGVLEEEILRVFATA